jgi:hypothetical protein
LAFALSLLGFLPVIGILVIAGARAAEVLADPQEYFELVRDPSPVYLFWIIAGNLGDAVGYYLVILPITVALVRQAKDPLRRAAGLLLSLYGVNGALWAIVSAVALPIVAFRSASDWALVTTICQSIGWGTIGNSLGSLGWLVLGISFFSRRRWFALFSITLGLMYFCGGEIASLFVPTWLGTVGIGFYLVFQLIVWNPWAAWCSRG